jgi:hypothetical protein
LSETAILSAASASWSRLVWLVTQLMKSHADLCRVGEEASHHVVAAEEEELVLLGLFPGAQVYAHDDALGGRGQDGHHGETMSSSGSDALI